MENLNNRYHLRDLIGEGGMALVYRGFDTQLEREVAIKIMKDTHKKEREFITRFEREAKIAAALQHNGIVRIYDYGESKNCHFMVYELIEGTNLRQYLKVHAPFDFERTIVIAHDIASALGAAHFRGIVHRDIKPANVLIERTGLLKLADFGIAIFYNDLELTQLTKNEALIGTASYMAPEQARKMPISPATDIYSLGAVMYEMITGQRPFSGSSTLAIIVQHISEKPTPPHLLAPNIPQALEEIIMRCLEKEPEMRYKNGRALANALENLADEDFIST